MTLPGNTRKPDSKPAQPVPPPTAPAETPAANTQPVPENFPGNLPPVVTSAPLSDDVLAIELAGLTMNLPMGSVVVQGANNEGTTYSIVAEDQSWRIEAQVHRTARADATVHDTAELVIRNVGQLAPVVRPGKGEMAPRVDTNVELLQRLTSFTIPGCATPGERLYFAVPATGGKRMMGYTILKPLPTTFVVFELSCDEAKFEKARAAYELSIATSRFEDPSKLIAARAAALTAGTEFLAQLSEEKLARLADGKEHWFRWWRPASGGTERDATEVGYRVLTVTKGRRSDIGAEGGGGRDNPAGLIVTTQVRLLQRGAGLGKIGTIIDSDTRAFCSFDRRDEAWVTTTIVRDLKTNGSAPPPKPSIFTETGVRSGTGMSIITKAPGKADSVISPSIKSTQYLALAEAPLLGSLLVIDAATAGTGGGTTEYGFYAYRADTQTISLRRESVGRDAARANAWTVRSRSRDEKSSTLNIYRDDGTLVRTELVDGSVWEPIEPEALLKLWKSKNLPVK